MFRKILREQWGYSLVEVMVSIMILSIAIIPMVAMFDMGLQSATTSGNYDKARTFANQQLERAKGLPYAQARDGFPSSGSTPNPVWGPSLGPDTIPGLPNGSYTIEKRYIEENLADVSADVGDTGLMKVTVTVNWGNGNSYTTRGVVGK